MVGTLLGRCPEVVEVRGREKDGGEPGIRPDPPCGDPAVGCALGICISRLTHGTRLDGTSRNCRRVHKPSWMLSTLRTERPQTDNG